MTKKSYPQILNRDALLSVVDRKMLKKARKLEFWYAAVSIAGGYLFLRSVSISLPLEKERPADCVYYCFRAETENWQKVRK